MGSLSAKENGNSKSFGEIHRDSNDKCGRILRKVKMKITFRTGQHSTGKLKIKVTEKSQMAVRVSIHSEFRQSRMSPYHPFLKRLSPFI